jgi:hypothetical protein
MEKKWRKKLVNGGDAGRFIPDLAMGNEEKIKSQIMAKKPLTLCGALLYSPGKS